MTALELENVFRSIDLQSLSDEEFFSFYSLLNLKESEIRWIINCRSHAKTHFSKKEQKD